MTSFLAPLAPVAFLGILALTACSGGDTPAATDPGSGAGGSEPGIATSCPEGVLDAYATYHYNGTPTVTELDAREVLDAIGLPTLKPAASCVGAIEHDGGTYTLALWLGAQPAFLDYIVDRMQYSGYEWNIDEATVKSFIGTASGNADYPISEAVAVGGWPEFADLVDVPFVTLEWEGVVP